MNLYQPTVSGSLVVSGSIIVSGSINATQGITASFSGNATSASYANNATTAYTASSVSNLNQNVQITGSLGVTSTITAQTLNVQTVTSSIVYSSGSNIFGNQLTDRQQMTGSLSVTGSITQTGFNVTNSLSGLVGVGTTTPTAIGAFYSTLDLRGSIGGGINFGVSGSTYAGLYTDSGGVNFTTNYAVPILFGVSGSERMRITSSSFGFGLNTPTTFFEVYGSAATNLAYYSTSGSTNRMILGARNVNGGALVDLRAHGATYNETILGNSMANAVGVVGAPATTASMVIGATTNSPVVLGTNNQEVMRVTGSFVGIGGTSNPFAKLTVANISTQSYGLLTYSTDWASGTTTWTGIKIGAAADTGLAGVDIRSYSNYSGNSGTDMALFTNSQSNVLTERMRITRDGAFSFNTGGPALLTLGATTSYGSITSGGGGFTIYMNGATRGGTTTAASNAAVFANDGNVYFTDSSTNSTKFLVSGSGPVCVNTNGSICKFVVADAGSVITGGDVTFDTQAKGIELYNTISGTTDNLVGYWFSVGPHKSGIASGRTNAGAGWELDLRFFTHGSATNNLNHTYENMRLYGNGNLTINGSLTQNGGLSDRNLKENIVKITAPLEKLSQINGYNFDWKEGTPPNGDLLKIVHDAGLIAQEVEEVMPNIVRENKEDGTKALNYNGVIALLVESVKEQQAQIEELRAIIQRNNLS